MQSRKWRGFERCLFVATVSPTVDGSSTVVHRRDRFTGPGVEPSSSP